MASAGAQAATITLTVNPTDPQTYSSVSAAVAAANADLNLDNYYDIKVATGTYTNDFANVLRPMTIEAAGGPVRLLATVPPLFNKGIIVTHLEPDGTRPDIRGSCDRRFAGRQWRGHP